MAGAEIDTGVRRDAVVAAAAAGAALPIVAMHVAAAGRVDPLAQTVSDYVAVPWGAAALVVAAAALAVAGVRIARDAVDGALPGARAVAALTALWVTALVLVATFPTNVDGAAPDLAAAVHRWSGAVVLLLPPVLALLVARATAMARLRRLAVATGVVDALFLLSHVPIVVLGSPGFPLLGMVERVLYALVIVLLPVMSTAVRRGVPAPVRAVRVLPVRVLPVPVVPVPAPSKPSLAVTAEPAGAGR